MIISLAPFVAGLFFFWGGGVEISRPVITDFFQAKSLYPRVPADVYLDVQDIGQKSAAPSSSKDPSGNDVEQQTGERFLSVVDIAKDDVRRRIEDSNETEHGGRHREYEDIPFDEGLQICMKI